MSIFTLVQAGYTGADLVSAGMPPDASRMFRDEKLPEMERWRALEPYWKFVRFTGYGQALRLAVRDLYGIREISTATITTLNEAIRTRNKAGLYQYVLRDRARIRFYVEDDSCGGCVKVRNLPENLRSMVLARRFDKFIIPATPRTSARWRRWPALPSRLWPHSSRLRSSFERNLSEGMRVVKVALAYYRELHFEEAPESEAERDSKSSCVLKAWRPRGFAAPSCGRSGAWKTTCFIM